MIGMPGMAEMAIIAGIATLIFGPRQIPRLAKGLGESLREFRKAGKELTSAIEDETKGDDR